jgi:hypothetical protein
MKKFGIIICALVLSTSAFSQAETQIKEAVTVEREVKVTEENGVKTVEVSTIEENGQLRYEKFVGAAAEVKLAELEKEQGQINAQGQRVIERKKILKEEKAVEPKRTAPENMNKLD